jgi:hypothetical protein
VFSVVCIVGGTPWGRVMPRTLRLSKQNPREKPAVRGHFPFFQNQNGQIELLKRHNVEK